MNEQKIRQIISQNSSDPYRLVEEVLAEAGLRREFAMRETDSRDGISISSKKTTPHERYVSEWRDMA